MFFLHIVATAYCGQGGTPEGITTPPCLPNGGTSSPLPTTARDPSPMLAHLCPTNCSLETVVPGTGSEFVCCKEPWWTTSVRAENEMCLQPDQYYSEADAPAERDPDRRVLHPQRLTYYPIRDYHSEKSKEDTLDKGEPEETVLLSLPQSSLLLPLSVAGFNFAYSEDDRGAPGWFMEVLEGCKELIENGITSQRLVSSILAEFMAYNDDTFMAENEDQLNSIVRSLERFERDRDPNVRWYGRPREIRDKDIRTVSRNTAVMVRHFWHWRRCPVAMENRVAEAHLRRLGIHPVALPPGMDWEEEKERRKLSRSRSPQRSRKPKTDRGEGDGTSLMQKRRKVASQDGDVEHDQRRRRTREWRRRVSTELAGLRTHKARAQARRNLFFQLCRVHGPNIVPFAETLMSQVWTLEDAEPMGRQSAEFLPQEWATRVAEEVGDMWANSRRPTAEAPSASTGSHVDGADGGEHQRLVRREVALDPPESTPFGVFHAAWVWPNGSWSTRGEMERMDYGYLVGEAGPVDEAHSPGVHEPDRAGGAARGRREREEANDDRDEEGPMREPDLGEDEERSSLVQGALRVRPTWRQLMEQLTEWQNARIRVTPILDVLRGLARRRGNHGYDEWFRSPIESLAASVEQDDQSTEGGPELDPSRSRVWAEDVEYLLWECFRANHLGLRRGEERDAVHLMERHRERAARRRVRARRRSRSSGRDRNTPHIRITESVRYLGDPRDCYTPREVVRSGGDADGPGRSNAGRGSAPRPTTRNSSGSGHTGVGSSTDPPAPRDLQQPLSRDEATDLWRYLLGVDRRSWPSRTRIIGAGQPFLPGTMQREIQTHFRQMSPQNRLVMTTNFIEMIRYLMAEISNIMHQADFMSTLPQDHDMVEVRVDDMTKVKTRS